MCIKELKMKILLATDGSKHSEIAAKKCASLLNKSKDLEIRIVSAAEAVSPVAPEQLAVSNDLFLRLAAESREAAETAVEDLKAIVVKGFDGDSPPSVETSVVSGSPREVIVDEAKAWGADLIVVGSHGYGFWDRMLLGSVSDAVIHHAPCSVLVVRD